MPMPELAAILLRAAVAAAPDMPAVAECTADALRGYVPSNDDVKSHRDGQIPPVEYADGASPGSVWGFDVELRIDESGRVECYRQKENVVDGKSDKNPQRHDWLRSLAQVRYRPFSNGGAPTAAIISEYVREVERTSLSALPDDVPLDQFAVTLERGSCFGSCPAYTVEIRGDGRVTYVGKSFVDVEGKYEYRIPVAAVARLADSVRANDLWSSRTEYAVATSHSAAYTVTIKAGERTHQVRDYVGHMVGMPVAITQFEDEIDKAAGTGRWIRLTVETIEQLDRTGFDFASAAGTALLWRVAERSNGDAASDKALLRLLQLGARADAELPERDRYRRHDSLLETVLENRNTGIAEVLIANGALETAGRVDPAKVDAAFRAAIVGGRLALVQRVWSAAGEVRPALEADDDDAGSLSAKRVPVALLLKKPHDDANWEGRQIAQWLTDQGAALLGTRADRDTLLHVATETGDAEFVRYLIERGLDPSIRGKYGLALDLVQNEDIALLLLDAGTDVAQSSDDGRDFRCKAFYRRWQRVTERLKIQR